MSRASEWTNPDGLVVGFGKHTTDNDVAAVYNTLGPLKTLSMVVNLADIEVAGSITAASFDARAARIPRGSHISKATLRMLVGAVGATATLGIGTYDADFSTITADDIDGIDAVIAVTAMNVIGDVVLCNGAMVGALDGTASAGAVSDTDVMIVMESATALFTAGRAELIVEFYPPSVDARTIAV